MNVFCDRWLRKLYWNNDAFSSTCNFDHIKTHYYWSHPHVRSSNVPVSSSICIMPLTVYRLTRIELCPWGLSRTFYPSDSNIPAPRVSGKKLRILGSMHGMPSNLNRKQGVYDHIDMGVVLF